MTARRHRLPAAGLVALGVVALLLAPWPASPMRPAGAAFAQDEGGDSGAGSEQPAGDQKLDKNDQMYFDVHTKLAAKALKAKNLAKARAELGLVLQVAPKSAVTNYRLAIVCAKAKDFTAAWRHLEIARPGMEKHAQAAHFKKFAEKLASVSPKPANLDLAAPKEALPPPKFQAEAAAVFLVHAAESKDVVSRIERFECTLPADGAFALTVVGSGPIDPGVLGNALSALPDATVAQDSVSSDSKRVTYKVKFAANLPVANPAIKTVTLSDYTQRRDQAATDADLSLRNARESETDPATGLMKGTYEFIASDLRGVLTMVNTISDCVSEFAVVKAGPAEFNQKRVWKGEIVLQVKVGG